MKDIADTLRTLRDIQGEVSESAVAGSLILVDLANSTQYKTRNGESAWLGRLFDFYDAVRRGLEPLKPSKYLGDAVLGFYAADVAQPHEVCKAAERVMASITTTNSARRYTGEHAMVARVVLNYGRVFLFQATDPQGTPVDKLFRMEKYVPDHHVGVIDEFLTAAKPDHTTFIGRFVLKGLAEGRHALHVLGSFDPLLNRSLLTAKRKAALCDIWDLGVTSDGKIVVVTGYIPPEPGQPATIHSGNKDAIVQVVTNLAKVERVSHMEMVASRDAREEHLRENLICIGGPYWNRVTLRLMREIRSPFVFDFSHPDDDRTPLHDRLTNKRFEAVWQNGRLCKDYGFFARFRNPFNPDRHVILACGIETHAVAGAVFALSEDQNEFLRLYDAIRCRGDPDASGRVPDFFALMPFDVEDSGAVHLPSGDVQTGGLVFDWSHGDPVLQEFPQY